MSEVRDPDRSPSSYSSAKANLREKIDALLTMMSPEARQAMITLANADAETRRTVLANLDSKTRAAIDAIETMIENL